MGQVSYLQQKGAEIEHLCAVVRGAGGMVHADDAIGHQCGYRVDVSCGEGSVAARRVRDRGVRAHPARRSSLKHLAPCCDELSMSGTPPRLRRRFTAHPEPVEG